jgi:hypothetical protein
MAVRVSKDSVAVEVSSISAAPAAQARLTQVRVSTETHQNGGLMKEMLAPRLSVKAVDGVQAQEHLSQVQIPVGN